MTPEQDKNCYCHTCDKSFHSLGIARHRAMHRDRQEECKITYDDGFTYNHDFALITDRFAIEKEK